jgi:hypothetical protein
MHPVAERNVAEYLEVADRLFKDRVVGLYVVGSVAYDAFRPYQSDLDLVVVLDEARAGDCNTMRRVMWLSHLKPGMRAAARLKHKPSGCNAAYVPADELTKPVTEIRPIGSHVAMRVNCGTAFDVNPVQWKTFAERGVAVRGAAPSSLGLDPEPARLKQWNLDNLNGYWTWASNKAASGKSPNNPLNGPRWSTAWNVLGPTRLHHTIATGEIVTKEQAGEYALEAFDAAWHPIIREGLACHRGEKSDPRFKDRTHRYQTLGAFGLHVIESANAL